MADRERNLIRLSESDFEIASGEPDPRGWEVFSADGRRVGEVYELIGDSNTRKVRFLECELDSSELGLPEDRQAMIPVGYARLDEDDERVELEGVTAIEVVGMPATITDIELEDEAYLESELEVDEIEAEELDARDRDLREARLTRSEEEMEIQKREIETGEVVLSKHVESEHVSRPVTRMREEVEVERRPTDELRADDRQFEEAEIRVPVREEEIEVRKRPEVKEEVIVRKRPVAEEEIVETDLLRERIDVEEHGRVARDRGEELDEFEGEGFDDDRDL